MVDWERILSKRNKMTTGKRERNGSSGLFERRMVNITEDAMGY